MEQSTGLNLLLNTKRNGRKVAVDTNIQTKSRMHKRQVGTFDIVQPPLVLLLYATYFGVTCITDSVDCFFTDGLTSNDMGVIDDFGRVITQDLNDIADTIDYAKELQCSQLLSNGIVTFRNNDNIDFGRNALSIAGVGAAKLWGTVTAEYINSLTKAVNWIRTNAKNNSTAFHAIMGADAFASFISSTEIKERNDIKKLPNG